MYHFILVFIEIWYCFFSTVPGDQSQNKARIDDVPKKYFHKLLFLDVIINRFLVGASRHFDPFWKICNKVLAHQVNFFFMSEPCSVLLLPCHWDLRCPKRRKAQLSFNKLQRHQDQSYIVCDFKYSRARIPWPHIPRSHGFNNEPSGSKS